ncbi:MAG: SDR family NAD(P)-dependent oxidoreductase [Alphaproteobacteria bacterium]
MADGADYKGRLALVTGAGDGIGAMLAHGFAGLGMRVCVQDIRVEAAEQVAEAIERAGGRAFPLIFDVSDRDGAAEAAEALQDRGERLSVLWLNAGVGVGSPVIAGKARAVEWAYAVNALGVIWTAQTFRPLMDTKTPACHVGITASTAALRPPEGPFPLYAATKHATFAIAESLRSELAEDGIGVTILCPGLLNTDIWDGARARPERFGGPVRMDPAIAGRWRDAKRPEVMWPYIERTVLNGGGYLVCATDSGETRAVFDARAEAIRNAIVEV